MPKDRRGQLVIDPGIEGRTAAARVGISFKMKPIDLAEVIPPEGGAAYCSPHASWVAYAPGCPVKAGGLKDPGALIVVNADGVVLAWIGISTPYISLPES